MAKIIIAYSILIVDGVPVRIYDDLTEKYFADSAETNAAEYQEYLQSKGLLFDVSEITILNEGDIDVQTMYRNDAILKLTGKEREALGLP